MAYEKILIVDDSPTTVFDFMQKLTPFGYKLFSAGAAGEALSILSRENPDLILLDNILPDITGIELLSQVRYNYPDSVFIIITASDSKEVVTQALKVGADDYLIKP